MKKLLTLFLVLVCSVSWGAGTTSIDEGLATHKPNHTFIYAVYDSNPWVSAVGTRFVLPWGTPMYDTLGEMSGATFTPKIGGRYSITVSTMPDIAVADKYVVHRVSVNGTSSLRDMDGGKTVSTYGFALTSHFEVFLAAGAKVEIVFEHSDSSPLLLAAAGSKLIIEYLGPLP